MWWAVNFHCLVHAVVDVNRRPTCFPIRCRAAQALHAFKACPVMFCSSHRGVTLSPYQVEVGIEGPSNLSNCEDGPRLWPWNWKG